MNGPLQARGRPSTLHGGPSIGGAREEIKWSTALSAYLFNGRIQVVDPTFAALLAGASLPGREQGRMSGG